MWQIKFIVLVSGVVLCNIVKTDTCNTVFDFLVDFTCRCDAISVEDGSVLAVLSHPAVVPLKGRVQICCLSGVANVMGFRLERGKKPCNVFSPDCYSLVTIATEAGEEDKDGTINYTQEHYKYLGVKSSKFLSSLRKTLNLTDSFVTLKFCRIETTLCKFIQSFHQYSNIFKSIGDKSIVNKKLLPLEVTSPGDISVPCLEVPAEVTDILNKWGEELDSEGQCMTFYIYFQKLIQARHAVNL